MKNNDYPLVKNAQNNFFDSLIDDNNLLIIAGPVQLKATTLYLLWLRNYKN